MSSEMKYSLNDLVPGDELLGASADGFNSDTEWLQKAIESNLNSALTSLPHPVVNNDVTLAALIEQMDKLIEKNLIRPSYSVKCEPCTPEDRAQRKAPKITVSFYPCLLCFDIPP